MVKISIKVNQGKKTRIINLLINWRYTH